MTEIMQKEKGSAIVSVGKIIGQALNEIETMIEQNGIDIPENYSYKNAIQQTRFALVKPIESGKHQGKTLLEVCTPVSILQAVIEMAQKGLSIAKKQCYFIPYGNSCTLSVSYQGNVAMAKRSGKDVEDILAYPVYEGDKFEIGYNLGKGILEIKTYEPDVTKWTKNKLIGAFAIVINSNGEVKYTEYMTIEQIKDAWNMGAAKGQSPAHKNFPDQQALKTVKSRAAKSYINSSDDSEVIDWERESIAYTDREFNKELMANANILEIPEAMERIDQETGEVLEENLAFTKEEQESMLNNVPF